MQSGELCRTCMTSCSKDYTDGITFILCPTCDGRDPDCPYCVDGQLPLTQCPMEILGTEFVEASNLSMLCGKGDWPVAGGLLDQSAWFVNLTGRLKQERNRIEAERNSGK